MKFSDMDEFLRDNPDWQEKRKLICTCEQQKYKEHPCPLDENDVCNCCNYCTTNCRKLEDNDNEL